MVHKIVNILNESQGSERACICVLGYWFPLFLRYCYWLLDCSDSVNVFVCHFIILPVRITRSSI